MRMQAKRFCYSTMKEQMLEGGEGEQGVNLPSPYFLSQFLPTPYFFEPISPSSLNGYVSFSPSSLLFPPISPSSQLCLVHFFLLPILFLPPLEGFVHKGDSIILKRNNLSLVYTISFSILYWNSLSFVSTVTVNGKSKRIAK